MRSIKSGKASLRSLLICIALAAWSASASATSCGDGSPRPAWVEGEAQQITERYFMAAGVSNSGRGGLADRLDTARQNAIRNLAQLIQVDVRNSLTVEQKQSKTGSSVLTEANVQSLTQTSTNLSLQNVEEIGRWIDPGSCEVWLQVRVEKTVVAAKRRESLTKELFKLFSGKLDIVQNQTLSLDARSEALDAASDVFPRIEFDFIPEASSAAYYSQLLKKQRLAMQEERAGLDFAWATLSAANGNVAKAGDETNPAARSKLFIEAARQYKSLLLKFPNGAPPLFDSGAVIYMKLGELEELRGDPCGAKNYYQQALEANQPAEKKPVAQKRADSLACSSVDMEKTRWRQFFEGRGVEVMCFQNVLGKNHVWQKACDEISNKVRSIGADTRIDVSRLTPRQLSEAFAGNVFSDQGANGRMVIAQFASGKMNKHRAKDESGRNGAEFQFNGMIWTLVLDDGKVVYSDRFQGVTGWNPVSPEMVMDVLALNVMKRWQAKFSEFLSQGAPVKSN